MISIETVIGLRLRSCIEGDFNGNCFAHSWCLWFTPITGGCCWGSRLRTGWKLKSVGLSVNCLSSWVPTVEVLTEQKFVLGRTLFNCISHNWVQLEIHSLFAVVSKQVIHFCCIGYWSQQIFNYFCGQIRWARQSEQVFIVTPSTVKLFASYACKNDVLFDLNRLQAWRD